MKRNIVLFVFLCFANSSFCEAINTYHMENLATIKFGKDEGKLGINRTPMGPRYPSAFAISNDNLVYVCDSVNRRINIYSLDFKFIKSITEKDKRGVYFSSKIGIDSNNDILSLSAENSDLLKINQNGDLLFRIKYADLPHSLTDYKEYFSVDNKVFFYDDDKEIVLNDKGERFSPEESASFFQSIEDANTASSMKIDSTTESRFKEIDKKENIVRFKGAILSTDFKKHRKYFESSKAGLKASQTQKNDDKFGYIISKDRTFSFIGFDKDNNSYWKSSITGMYESAFVVCSNIGEILDYFTTELNTSVFAVAPSGDIYLMDDHATKDGFPFYKITRRW